MTEKCQSTVLLFLASVKALLGKIQRERAMFQLQTCPGDHLCVVARVRPKGLQGHLGLEPLIDILVIQFDIHFVAYFDQQRNIVLCA